MGQNVDLSAAISVKSSDNQGLTPTGTSAGRVADVLAAHQAKGDGVRVLTEQMAAGLLSRTGSQETATSAVSEGTSLLSQPGGQAAQSLTQKLAVLQTPVTDKVSGLPKLQFLSNDTALRTGTVESVSDAPASTLLLSSNTPLPTATAISSVMQSDAVLTPMARSAVTGGSYTYDPSNNYFSGNYDVSAYGNIDSATTSNWSWSGNGGSVGGGGLTPKDAARLASNIWDRNAADYGQKILGRALRPDEVHAYHDIIHGKVKSHHKSPADAIYSQLYKIASSEEAARKRNEIAFSLTGQPLSTQEQVNWAKRIAEGSSSLDTLRSEKAHTDAAANKIYDLYHAAAGITANRDQVTSLQDALGRGDTTIEKMRGIVASREGNDAIRKVYREDGGVTANAQQIQSWQDALARGDTTIEKIRGIIASREGNDAIRKVYDEVGGVTANAQQIQSWQDALARGDTTIEKIRGIIASREGNDALRNFYPTILDRAASDQEIANSQNALAQGKSLNDIRNDIVRSSEAQGHVDTFLTKTFGQASDDLRSAGTMALSNLSQAYQTFRNYSSDELHSLANGFQATFNAGSNILQNLLPNTPQGWLELGAMIAIDLTPPGEAVFAGEVLTLGGEKLLEKGLTILESRFIGDIETKSTQIISEEGKKFIIDDIAKRTAPHAEKHIDDLKHPQFSLRNIGINDVNDIENYIRETLNDAPNNPQRYEVASDIRNDRLAVWDKKNETITIFNPKGNRDTKGFGSIYRPERGYNEFLDIKNGK